MTEIREIPIQFPGDDAHCKLIADQLAATGFHELARQLRVAVMPKPAIEEPKEFASVVRATSHGEPMLWQKTPMHGKHYWESETGAVEVWYELTDVEVLRVGLGEPLAEWETDILNQQARRDIAAAVLSAMDVDQYLIDAVANARPR